MPSLRCKLPDCDWRPPSPDAWPSWKGAKRICIDAETHDEDLQKLGVGVRRGAYSVGYGIGIEDGPRVYLPFRHGGGDNLDPDQVLAYMRHQAKTFDGTLVFTNASYDLDYLDSDGVAFPCVRGYRDVQIAEPLLDEYSTEYNLEYLGNKHLSEGKDESVLRAALHAIGAPTGRAAKGWLWRLPGRYAGMYGEADVDRPLRILRRQEKLIEDEELDRVYELESSLIPLFFLMKKQGIPVDQDKLGEANLFFIGKRDEAIAAIRHETGVNITDDVMGPSSIAKALKEIGIDVPVQDAQGTISVTQPWLEAQDHPVCRLAVRARKMEKARGTFVAQIANHMVKGRVHCNYNQLKSENEQDSGTKGTVTGRPSMDHPNLLFMPIRDEEIGPLFRKIFVADEGKLWAKADYSQQEPRMQLHFSVLMNLPGARDMQAKYLEDPHLDCYAPMVQESGLIRRQVKTIYLGLSYDMGGAKLCRSLGLPTEWKFVEKYGKEIEIAGPEGQAILDRFDGAAPYIKKFSRKAKEVALSRGFVRDIVGRKFRFPDESWARKAGNKIIQGSAASQTKKAMLDVYQQTGVVPSLQVYDELDCMVDDERQAQQIACVMENTMQLTIPFVSDVHLGKSWGDCA